VSDAPDLIALSVPGVGDTEAQWLGAALHAPRLAGGAMVERFESEFAARLGRRHGVAAASGTIATLLALRALDIGPGDEVITSPLAWHQVAQAIVLAGATPVCADIDYWSGCLDAARAAARVSPRTKAILAGNTNGHPAAWGPLRELASHHGLHLIEDSTEAIGSRYRGRPVGSFGDVAVFDFSAPGVIDIGCGAMLVTDDDRLASELRYGRERQLDDRDSISVGSRIPLQAGLSDLAAALGLAQLIDLPRRLARRHEVVSWYHAEMQAFEGIKPPYLGPEVDEVHWMLFVVHLGKRFGASARRQMVEDLAAGGVETAAYCQPLHQQFAWQRFGITRGDLPLAERIGERMLALPLHTQLDADEVKFIVSSLKDAATNVGAGAAIYL
jgi:dTDP-4-amino-4,6-dideoxygalactose transaminase